MTDKQKTTFLIIMKDLVAFGALKQKTHGVSDVIIELAMDRVDALFQDNNITSPMGIDEWLEHGKKYGYMDYVNAKKGDIFKDDGMKTVTLYDWVEIGKKTGFIDDYKIGVEEMLRKQVIKDLSYCKNSLQESKAKIDGDLFRKGYDEAIETAIKIIKDA